MYVLAEDFTFGHFLLGVLYIFGFVILFWLMITVFADMFRRHDVSGWIKAVWVVFIILLPFLGVFAYIITQGHGMAERNQKQAARAVLAPDPRRGRRSPRRTRREGQP